MADGSLGDVLRYLRRFAAPRDAAAETDCALLDRFVRDGDEAAFEALLSRHGPMVWGVCRGLLFDAHAAEDAFQATFLVLVRKAGSLGRRELVANWLYGVAQRVARRARATAARRHERERPAAEPAGVPKDDPASRDLVRVIHEELDRLPAKYRSPVVLCCLEGKTCEEAASELGWTKGAGRGRLERARGRLRDRLIRRGLTLSTALLADPLAELSVAAAVPRPMLVATLKAGLLLAVEGAAAFGSIPPSVSILAKGALHAMFLTKVTTAAVLILAGASLTLGTGTAMRLQAGAQAPEKETAEKKPRETARDHDKEIKAFLESNERNKEPPPVVKQPEERIKVVLANAKAGGGLKLLLKEQYDAAQTETWARWKQYLHGRETLDIFLGASLRLLQAELDLSDKQADRVAAFETHWQRMKDAETVNRHRFDAGRVTVQDLAQSRYNRARAEIWLERARAGQAVNLDRGIGDVTPAAAVGR